MLPTQSQEPEPSQSPTKPGHGSLRLPRAQPSPVEDRSVFQIPEQCTVGHTLTGAKAKKSLFTSIKTSNPPFVYGAKIFAINTT